MRLLCVGNRYPPWSSGGYEVVWSAAVAELQARGHELRVLTTLPDRSDSRPDAPIPAGVFRELAWYWSDHAFPPRSFRSTLALERGNAAVLSKHLRELSPDAVIWWAMGGMSLSLIERVRRAGLPAVGVVGDDWMLYGPRVDAWTRRWRGRLGLAAGLAEQRTGIPARIDLDRAARWLFNSDYLLSSARAAGWRLPDAGLLAPGVDPARFSAQPPNDWGWRLLYCGRLDRRKGIDVAIAALSRLPAQSTLRIHGDGSEDFLDELHALTVRLGVAERVEFSHGPHEQVPAVYGACDAVLFPVSWHEPWGLVPLEAMAVGRPVIASRAGGGPAEYLDDGANCLTFAPGDPDGLAAAVMHLAESEQLRSQLVAGGLATASRFTEPAFHDRLEQELEHAVRSRSTR